MSALAQTKARGKDQQATGARDGRAPVRDEKGIVDDVCLVERLELLRCDVNFSAQGVLFAVAKPELQTVEITPVGRVPLV